MTKRNEHAAYDPHGDRFYVVYPKTGWIAADRIESMYFDALKDGDIAIEDGCHLTDQGEMADTLADVGFITLARPPGFYDCDCCGRPTPKDMISRVWAYGIETLACEACRQVEQEKAEEVENPDCTCGWSSVNSQTIDPPERVVNRWCPVHGCEAARDPDSVMEKRRDDARWFDWPSADD